MKTLPIYISDTTLREGDQTPGVAFSKKDKLLIAQQLVKLNVDEIEAGFPGTSTEETKSIEAICEHVKEKRIAVLIRALREDIDIARKTLRLAQRPVVTIFCPASNLHIKAKLNKTKNETLKMVIDAIQYAKRFFEEVVFSAEDATRADHDYLLKMISRAIDAGATTISIPDTVGYVQPSEFGHMIEDIHGITKGIVDLRVHCHNDLGLAVANSLAAIENGANVISCTVNGLGERCGNAPLEEVVMGLEVRKDRYKRHTNIYLREIYNTSKLVSELSGIRTSGNKPIVGENAFIHSAGIHQHGVLRDRRTYEIMSPNIIGAPESRTILGKHSGKHALLSKIRDLGFSTTYDDTALSKILLDVKELAIAQKEVSDADLLRILKKNGA